MNGNLTAAELDRERRISDDRDCLTSADLDSGFATTVTLLCDLRYPHWLHHDGQTGIWWASQVPADVPAMPLTAERLLSEPGLLQEIADPALRERLGVTPA